MSHIANKNINLPILGNVLVKSEDKVLKFMTTNLEIAVSCAVRGKVEEPGEFTVPSRLFSDYIALLPKERVDVAQDGNAVAVACGSFQTRLNGIAASEFPLIPAVDKKRSFLVDMAVFRRAIGQVLFAVAPNESRPEISGVLFKLVPRAGGADLVLAATDSYRLAEKTVPAESSGPAITEPWSVIVPSRTVAEIVRILGVLKDSLSGNDKIEIGVGDSQIVFSYDDVQVTSRIIEGRYPDYHQLVPERFETEVIIAKEDLQRAVKAASLFSRTGLNDVHITFSPDGRVRLKAGNSQAGEHSAELMGKVKGKENEVTVNFKYLLDGVGNIETDSIGLQMVDKVSPCLVRPVKDDQLVLSDFMYIVMPIRQ